jgi:6-phosphogluconolactonase
VTATTIVYVACAGSREIHCLYLDANSGVLKPLDVVTVPGGNEASPSNMPMALSPGGAVLHAALRTAPFPVTSFAVDRATGKLTWRSTASLPAPMAYISVEAGGRFLMAASYKEGKLSVSEVTPEGVRAPPVQVLATPPKAHCIISGRPEDIVYATTVEGNAIMVFHLDAETGCLAQSEPHFFACRPGSGPRHLALHPRLNVLYCVNELAGTLAAIAIENETGALSEMQYETLTPPGFRGNARAADLHVTSDGRFAYASVRNTNSIAGFRIDPGSGALSPMGIHQVEASPRSFALDRTGRFLICAGQQENVVGVYSIDPANGVLTPLHRYFVGLNPSWVEVLALEATTSKEPGEAKPHHSA